MADVHTNLFEFWTLNPSVLITFNAEVWEHLTVTTFCTIFGFCPAYWVKASVRRVICHSNTNTHFIVQYIHINHLNLHVTCRQTQCVREILSMCARERLGTHCAQHETRNLRRARKRLRAVSRTRGSFMTNGASFDSP